MRQVISAPVTVVRGLADDVASTLRRPDAVLYLGGVVGLAALGILEWPVAAVAGVSGSLSPAGYGAPGPDPSTEAISVRQGDRSV